MATFLEVISTGGGKQIINISRITRIRADGDGCTIRFEENDFVQTSTPYQEIKKAIEDAPALQAQIHSIADGKAPDARPPRDIRVY